MLHIGHVAAAAVLAEATRVGQRECAVAVHEARGAATRRRGAACRHQSSMRWQQAVLSRCCEGRELPCSSQEGA